MGSTPIASTKREPDEPCVFAQGRLCSTNRNAVEPAESGVKSLGSAGFLFVEKGAEGYS